MKPDSSDQTELLRKLRQQLILAQVRIMELEDARDAQVSRLAEAESLLQAAQTLADQNSDIARNLKESGADCLQRLKTAEEANIEQSSRAESSAATNLNLKSDLTQLQQNLSHSRNELKELAEKIAAMESTRSWRWTAWLRSLGL